MFKFNKDNNLFGSLTPKITFFIGLISGFLIFSTIGFFTILPFYLNKVKEDKVVTNQNSNINFNQNVNQAVPTGNLADNLKAITNNDHLRGDKSAPVIMVEFSDFQCPYCARVHPTLQKIVNYYQGQVAWVYKHFPLEELHPFAQKAALASECAAEQNKFWEFADQLYPNQSKFSDSYFSEVALGLSLNSGQFNDCLAASKYLSRVTDNYQEGVSVGISGTPGIYVNDQLIKGAYPYETFKQVIDSILAD